jgi:N-glycosylase/DNA lyase
LKIKGPLFDLNQSLCCGQTFRWQSSEDHWWYSVVNDRIVKVRQIEEELEFEIQPGLSAPKEFISNYFRFDDDLESIYQKIGKDDFLIKAISQARGLRVIRQDPWECMISFIVSQQNQIPKITRSIETMAQKFGTCTIFEGKNYYLFPTPEQLCTAKIKTLQSGFNLHGCALGYRARYVLGTAYLIYNNALEFRLDDLKKLPYNTAYRLLIDSFFGIGPKVADCVLLFALDKLEAFPLDTWTRRIIRKLYFNDERIKDEKIKEFCADYFGEFAGYAQEYLFCNRINICQSNPGKNMTKAL